MGDGELVADITKTTPTVDLKPKQGQPAPKSDKPSTLSSAASSVKEAKSASEIPAKTSWQLSSEIKERLRSLTGEDNTISIKVDKATHTFVVEVMNSKTGEVIRRVPPEELGSRLADLGDLTGLSLDVTA